MPDGGHEIQHDAEQLLGELEATIMHVIWSRGEVTVRDVLDIIHERRPLAYTTVMTVMSRLAQKGVLSSRKHGKTYYYSATLTPQELVAMRAQRAVDDVLATFGDAALTHFLRELDQMHPERLAALHRLAKKEHSNAD
ncbi:MAG: BlaI/MecI/CopY family transcriptional regulator [Herpetosiphon sp.]